MNKILNLPENDLQRDLVHNQTKKTNNLLLIAIVFGISLICYNFTLVYPDINDFYELSRICLLMDDNIKYCVNINWGFAHPLSCWLATKLTGDLLVSQRLISSAFSLIFLFVLINVLKKLGTRFSKLNIVLLTIFLCSPWLLELALSVHLDIVPITCVFFAVLLILKQQNPYMFLLAGFVAGISYWFRFHFLSFAVLFPVLTFFMTLRDNSVMKKVIFTSVGSFSAILIPHILCLLSYGLFSISNEKFVLAFAFGIVDWTYESAKKLESFKTIDLFKHVDWKIFLLKYCYHFLKSGLFPVLIIMIVSIKEYTKQCKKYQTNVFDFLNRNSSLLLLSLYGFLSAVPFTIVRGFTYRLEAAFVFFVIPILLWFTQNSSKKLIYLVVCIFIVDILYQEHLFWTSFVKNKSSLVTIGQSVKNKIPLSILKNEQTSIVSCVDYYNPYNKYHLCNPMVFAGWGVRFEPFIEKFGFLNMSDPFDNEIYSSAKYILLPSNPTYFEYDKRLRVQNTELINNNEIIILSR